MLYYIKGPYDLPYMVDADSAQEALEKCVRYEQTIYDSWACDIFDIWPHSNDFKHITLEEFQEYEKYHDLVNYDWSKCVWGTKDFCEIRKQE